MKRLAGEQVLRRIAFYTAFAFVFAIVCTALTGGAEASRPKKSGSSDNPKYASIVVDAETGAVLSERFANKKLHPASLTKVMTLMLLFESLENGNVRLNDRIIISQRAAAQQPSKLGLSAGASIRVEDAILAVVTKSANDISVAIAEHLAGSESRFAARMTKRAHDIGMLNTTFRNASGLHNPGQISTARDMATLARYVLARYPNYYRYFGTKQFTYRGKTMTNHNRLMNSYPGMDGFKTGFINASGFNLIASARRDGRRLIGVVFGGRSWKSRNDHMAEILNAGFSKMGDTRYARAATPTEKSIPVVDIAQAAEPAVPPMPLPAAKPVFKVTGAAQQAPQPSIKPSQPNTLQLPPGYQGKASPTQQGFTSLSSLGSGQRIVMPAPQAGAAQPQADVTEQAVADVNAALNRGDYSELTGEGDYDPGTIRRVQAGLLSAAVYKGEHKKHKQEEAVKLQQIAAATAQGIPAQAVQTAPVQTTQPTPAAIPPAPTAASDLWSVQIGAYTSRVATDDALRLAAAKLPPTLSHAMPLVVPLKTSEGILFRARLGGFSKSQAVDACRYFRDCLPVAPR